MKNYNVILLHGWGQNNNSMNCFKENLKEKYSALNLNLLKTSQETSYDFNDYIEDLHNKINHLDNIVLIGHSFGGKIASLYATKYKVEKLILIAPSTIIKKTLITRLKIIISKTLNKMNLKSHRFESNDYKKLLNKERITFKNIINNIDVKSLKTIKCPTLIIGFKNDLQVPLRNIKFLNKKIQNSKTIIYAGNHFAFLDYCEQISLNIMDFLND